MCSLQSGLMVHVGHWQFNQNKTNFQERKRNLLKRDERIIHATATNEMKKSTWISQKEMNERH